jgi:integrase
MEAFMTELGKWWEDENLRAQMTSFRFYVIAELQYATGLRAGEVADLEEGDLDLRSLEVTVRQGKEGRTGSSFSPTGPPSSSMSFSGSGT